jgi:LysR family transcriptional regulator, regulator for bpeEF and oprC
MQNLSLSGSMVAIRMGPLSDSTLVATRLGTFTQYLCATRSYLDVRGRPRVPADLIFHQTIDFPGSDGRSRTWHLSRGENSERVEQIPRVEVNDALTICAPVDHGVGIGPLSAYLCGDDIRSGKLKRVLPDWSLPPLPISLIFASRREVSPVVRAFVDYMREVNAEQEG